MHLRRFANLSNRFTKNETHARAAEALYYLTNAMRTVTTRRGRRQRGSRRDSPAWSLEEVNARHGPTEDADRFALQRIAMRGARGEVKRVAVGADHVGHGEKGREVTHEMPDESVIQVRRP